MQYQEDSLLDQIELCKNAVNWSDDGDVRVEIKIPAGYRLYWTLAIHYSDYEKKIRYSGGRAIITGNSTVLSIEADPRLESWFKERGSIAYDLIVMLTRESEALPATRSYERTFFDAIVICGKPVEVAA